MKMNAFHDDLKHLADPNCRECRGRGRYPDYSEDERGMVMWIKCDCVKKAEAKKASEAEDELYDWPCQALHGGRGEGIYANVDGRCQHPECHPRNDDRDSEEASEND